MLDVDALKGLMSPGAEFCQLPSTLSIPALKARRAVISAAAFSPPCSCNPSQIEHKPQPFPDFIPARTLELYTAALIVSLKTI